MTLKGYKILKPNLHQEESFDDHNSNTRLKNKHVLINNFELATRLSKLQIFVELVLTNMSHLDYEDFIKRIQA